MVLHDRQQGELTDATVIDGVRLVETQTAQIGDLPLLVTGGSLCATEANSPQAKVTVLGKPAHMEGRGMSLTGPSIAIDAAPTCSPWTVPARWKSSSTAIWRTGRWLAPARST